MNMLYLIIFDAHALALLASCFCRLSKTCKARTKPVIRWTFTALSIVAAWCSVAPWIFGYQPDMISTALVSVIAYTQIVTAHYWRSGVPPSFQVE